MRAPLILGTFVFVLLSLAGPVQGIVCEEPTTSPATLTIGDGSPGSASFYLVVDSCGDGCSMIFLYEEGNGRWGLSRADELRDDTGGCGGWSADIYLL